MNLKEKLARARSTKRIDFSKYQSINLDDPLVVLKTNNHITVKPVWTLQDDFEGGMYRDFIAKHPGYDNIYVRSELANRLELAAQNLDKRFKIVIQAGHRPMEVQINTLKGCKNDYLKEHPDATEKEALEHARTFVSDPDVELPPHCCGAAVDILLFDTISNKDVDFGSPVNLAEEVSYLYTNLITHEQQANREILLQVMLNAGFASTAFEWWHFSYGDQVWAWFYGEVDSLYSPIDLKL